MRRKALNFSGIGIAVGSIAAVQFAVGATGWLDGFPSWSRHCHVTMATATVAATIAVCYDRSELEGYFRGYGRITLTQIRSEVSYTEARHQAYRRVAAFFVPVGVYPVLLAGVLLLICGLRSMARTLNAEDLSYITVHGLAMFLIPVLAEKILRPIRQRFDLPPRVVAPDLAGVRHGQ